MTFFKFVIIVSSICGK